MNLRDYLRVLRRYRLMIAALAIVGAVAGYLAATRQTPVYQATAEISFEDPSQDLSIAGIGSNASQTPAEVAAINADTATTPSVMAAALRRLRAPAQPARTAPKERGGRLGRGAVHRARRVSRRAPPDQASLSRDGLLGPEASAVLADAISTQVTVPAGLLQVTATDPDPNLAFRIANTVAGAIVDRDNAQTRAQFASLVGNVERQIASLQKGGANANSTQLGYYQAELARLNTVANLARSAQIADPAQIPTSPSTPGKSRNVALGFALGLLLGVLGAFVRDTLDRRLRDLPDVTSSFRLPVLGHAREQTLGRVIHGASDADGGRDLESFRILRRNLDFVAPSGPPRSILVTSAVPEEGKTTVAASLALALVAAGRRVLLIDCDLRRSSLAGRLQAQPRPGLTDYLSGETTLQDISQIVPAPGKGPTPDAKHGPSVNGEAGASNGHGSVLSESLVFIASGSRNPRGAELLGSPRFAELLAEVSDSYDAVVLDSSPLLPVSDTRELLPHVDAVLLCARAARTTRDQANAAVTALSHFPQRPTGLVITGVSAHADDYGAYEYVYEEAH